MISAIKSEEGKSATFSHGLRFETLFATNVWISQRHLCEAKASKKSVLKLRYLRLKSLGGSNGLLGSSFSTAERFHLGCFRRNWAYCCGS